MDDFVLVPWTNKIDGIPTIYVGNAHKGILDIILEHNKKYKCIEGVNVDCIHGVYDLIDSFNVYCKYCEKYHGFNLDKALRLTLNYIWTMSTQGLSKCFNCILDDNWDIIDKSNKECMYNVMEPTVDYDVYFNFPRYPITMEDYMPDAPTGEFDDRYSFFTAKQLKDIDLREEGVLCLECSIKNIKNPIICANNQYEQSVLCYDSNTNKTLNATFKNECADFDKWEKGDRVLAIGKIDNDYKRPFQIEYAKKIESDSAEEPIITNRNDETPGYNEWRQSIINRDEKCVCCGLDKHLEAHHLFGYAENPALAVDEHNGVTLCKFCHDKYHSIYGVKDINPVDFVEFVKKFGVVR